MVFSTPIFMFYFLVLTLAVYYVVPRKGRNVVLLIASLFFYWWGERAYVAIMFLSTAIDYTHGLLVERCKARGNDKGTRMAVASSVVFNLALLGFFKYWDFIAGSLQSLVIPTFGSNTDGAYAFMNYMLSPAAQELMVKQMAAIPLIDASSMDMTGYEDLQGLDVSNFRLQSIGGLSTSFNERWDSEIATIG